MYACVFGKDKEEYGMYLVSCIMLGCVWMCVRACVGGWVWVCIAFTHVNVLYVRYDTGIS